MIVPDWAVRAAGLFGTAFAISWLLTMLLIRLAPQLGLVDYPNERKVHTHPTPRGGGLAIFLAVILSHLWSWWNDPIWYWPPVDRRYLFAAAIVLLGLVDDYRPVSWWKRLVVQFAVCFLAVHISLWRQTSLPERIGAMFWIVLHINAFNMLDNMDALSGGVAWIAAGFLAAADMLSPGGLLNQMYVILMGTLTGFLWFNWPPARIFLGDAGSTLLGFLLGLGTMQSATRQVESWAMAAPLCILAVPCYDLVSVVLLRLSQGRSPFHADKQHLSHRLVARGLSQRTAVGVIHLMALASGASGLVIYAWIKSQLAALLIVGQLALWWIALAVIEFATKKETSDDAQTQTDD